MAFRFEIQHEPPEMLLIPGDAQDRKILNTLFGLCTTGDGIVLGWRTTGTDDSPDAFVLTTLAESVRRIPAHVDNGVWDTEGKEA